MVHLALKERRENKDPPVALVHLAEMACQDHLDFREKGESLVNLESLLPVSQDSKETRGNEALQDQRGLLDPEEIPGIKESVDLLDWVSLAHLVQRENKVIGGLLA